MRRGRYEIGTDWTPLTRETVLDYGDDAGEAVTEVASLRDTRTGDIYPRGARRVTVKVTGAGKRSKTFVGEFAWAQANSWADDTIDALLRKRNEVTR
jgi:hypothetical protein